MLLCQIFNTNNLTSIQRTVSSKNIVIKICILSALQV